jgi:hypothetical protein
MYLQFQNFFRGITPDPHNEGEGRGEEKKGGEGRGGKGREGKRGERMNPPKTNPVYGPASDHIHLRIQPTASQN